MKNISTLIFKVESLYKQQIFQNQTQTQLKIGNFLLVHLIRLHNCYAFLYLNKELKKNHGLLPK